jgi:ribosome maturation factor RimP
MIDEKYIVQLAEEKINGSGSFLVEVKLSPNRIAVLVDKPEGIKIEECAELSRYLSDKLEESGLLDSRELEVGSPGMDQPLKVYKQYLRRIGKRVRVITTDGKIHNGVLQSANENEIILLESFTLKEEKNKIKKEEERKYLFSEIKETRIEFSFQKV